MSKQLKTVLAFIFMVTAITLLFIKSNSIDQRINLRKAEKHVKIIEQTLKQHPALYIQVSSSTGPGGSIILNGTVKSEQERKELLKIIASTNPPVKIVDRLLLQNELKQEKQKAKENK